MKSIALILILAGVPGDTCLARKSAVSTSTAPTFRTELECELWEAVVLLEGDVRTATSALASCNNALLDVADTADDRAPVPDLPMPSTASPLTGWAGLLGGVALGILVGTLLGRIEVKL